MFEPAYVAGLFDGEGWITVSTWHNAKKQYPQWSPRYIRHQLMVGIANTNKPLIDRIHQQFGGDLYINNSANKKNPNNRLGYTWRKSSLKASEFLELLLPYLVVKREEAILAIELQKHITDNKNVVRYKPERADEIYSHRQHIADSIRALKKRRWDTPVSSDPRTLTAA